MGKATPSGDTGTPLELSALRLGATLGAGGEGTVHEIVGRPDVVLKRYHRAAPPDPGGLDALIGLRAHLDEAESTLLDRCCAWPDRAVTEDGRPVGFLMTRVPDRFGLRVPSGPAAGRRVLTELQHLLFPRKHLHGLRLPDYDELRRLCAGWAAVLELLHHHEVIVGDVSPRNWLWSLAPEPAVFLIDCDSFRRRGSSSVLRPKQTPDWDDPALRPGERTTLESDRYKFATAVVRVFAGDAYRRPGHDVPPPLSAMPDVAALAIRAAGPPRSRPTAVEWRAALEAAEAPAGGPVTGTAGERAGSSGQQPALAAVPGRGPRPVLDLQRPPPVQRGPLPETIARPVRPQLDLS